MSEKKLGLIAAWSWVILLAALLLSPLRSRRPDDFMLMYFAGKLAGSGQTLFVLTRLDPGVRQALCRTAWRDHGPRC